MEFKFSWASWIIRESHSRVTGGKVYCSAFSQFHCLNSWWIRFQWACAKKCQKCLVYNEWIIPYNIADSYGVLQATRSSFDIGSTRRECAGGVLRPPIGRESKAVWEAFRECLELLEIEFSEEAGEGFFWAPPVFYCSSTGHVFVVQSQPIFTREVYKKWSSVR